MEEIVFFRKLSKAEPFPFSISVSFNRNVTKLTILQKNSAWETLLTKADLEELAKQSNSSLEQYCKELREHLEKPNETVIFSLKELENAGQSIEESVPKRRKNKPENIKEKSIELIIYKIVKSESRSLRIKYFAHELKEVDYLEKVDELLLGYSFLNSQLVEKLRETENREVAKDNDIHEYKTHLKEFVDTKIKDEDELCGNFLAVLNEKKLQIQHLNEVLEVLKKGERVSLSGRPQKSEVSNESGKHAVVSESESYDTEDDFEKEPYNFGDLESPSTSVTNILSLDESQTKKSSLLPPRQKLEKTEKVVNYKATKIDQRNEETGTREETSKEKSELKINLNTQDYLDDL